MKYIGFIKEHSPISEAIPFESISNSKELDDELIGKIESYLNDGVLIFSWMRYLNDLENSQPICPDGYYTDGTWVWPMYLTHYLKKKRGFPFDQEFIEFIKNENFVNKAPHLEIDNSLIESELSKKFDEYARQSRDL